MGKYLELAQSLMTEFTRVNVAQIPKSENRMADALVTLASSALYPCHVELTIMTHHSIYNAEIHIVENRAENS